MHRLDQWHPWNQLFPVTLKNRNFRLLLQFQEPLFHRKPQWYRKLLFDRDVLLIRMLQLNQWLQKLQKLQEVHWHQMLLFVLQFQQYHLNRFHQAFQ